MLLLCPRMTAYVTTLTRCALIALQVTSDSAYQSCLIRHVAEIVDGGLGKLTTLHDLRCQVTRGDEHTGAVGR